MILPDFRIKMRAQQNKLIEPFIVANLQPASVDLTLANDFRVPSRLSRWADERMKKEDFIDLDDFRSEDHFEPSEILDRFVLWPQRFALGRTVERINLPDDMVGRIEGKSSLGRIGLLVHATAGFCDPGFCGTITLELYNLGLKPIILLSGKRICQISFSLLEAAALTPYGSQSLSSKYQHQEDNC